MTEEVGQTLVERLRTRAQIRRSITTRKSVQNKESDRIADLLEEAATQIDELQGELSHIKTLEFERGAYDYSGAQWDE